MKFIVALIIMENDLLINTIGWAIVLSIIFFKSYFSKKGENLATKQDIREITRKVEEIKRDLRVEERYKIERLLSEREAIINYGAKLITFVNYLVDLDFISNFNNENRNIRFIEIKKKTRELFLDYSKLELFIDDPALLKEFFEFMVLTNTGLVIRNLELIKDLNYINKEIYEIGIDSHEAVFFIEQRSNDLFKRGNEEITKDFEKLQPKIQSLKKIIIEKLKNYAN